MCFKSGSQKPGEPKKMGREEGENYYEKLVKC